MNQDTTPMTAVDQDVEAVVQESTKRKRQMSESSLQPWLRGERRDG